jgi:NAD(P)-dependent dehydrogenase (short-subunit alcohol dehydrogenase family)
MEQANEPAVLVTGCGSGIGAASAHLLAERGFRVFAGLRDIGQAPPELLPRERFQTIVLDLEQQSSITAAKETVAGQLKGAPLLGIVNVAGIAVPGPLEMIPVEMLRHQLEVNVTGQFAVTQAFLSCLAAPSGRIVFMGSTSGSTARPFCGAYCASKFALRALADTWRHELEPFGQSVCLIEADKIATPIWEKSQERLAEILDQAPPEVRHRYPHVDQMLQQPTEEELDSFTSADDVAEAVWQALTSVDPPPVIQID